MRKCDDKTIKKEEKRKKERNYIREYHWRRNLTIRSYRKKEKITGSNKDAQVW